MTDNDRLSTDDIAAGDRDRQDAPDSDPASVPLFSTDDAERYREKWMSVQGEFVDRPREAVEQADTLVADLMQRLAGQFSETRQTLEEQWGDDDEASTEDLRVALTRYRSFFERLLTA